MCLFFIPKLDTECKVNIQYIVRGEFFDSPSRIEKEWSNMINKQKKVAWMYENGSAFTYVATVENGCCRECTGWLGEWAVCYGKVIKKE